MRGHIVAAMAMIGLNVAWALYVLYSNFATWLSGWYWLAPAFVIFAHGWAAAYPATRSRTDWQVARALCATCAIAGFAGQALARAFPELAAYRPIAGYAILLGLNFIYFSRYKPTA